MRQINRIFWHCSASPEGQELSTEAIKRWHTTKAKPWSDIGYHYVIELDASRNKGRPDWKPGAGVAGYNEDSLHICYVGGITNDGKKTPKDTRTPEQKAELYRLTEELLEAHPGATVHGHNEFDKHKACPSFDVQKDWADYLASKSPITPGLTPADMRDEDFDDKPGQVPEELEL